jgi:PAS domain-containing protein
LGFAWAVAAGASGLGVVGQAENALPGPDPNSASFHRGLIEGMRCGILTIDRHGKLVMVNDHARQILS